MFTYFSGPFHFVRHHFWYCHNEPPNCFDHQNHRQIGPGGWNDSIPEETEKRPGLQWFCQLCSKILSIKIFRQIKVQKDWSDVQRIGNYGILHLLQK